MRPDRLQECRARLNWTQSQVAAALKVRRELVAMWEAGTRKTSLKQLEELSRLYRTDIGYLQGQSNVRCATDRMQLLYRGIEQDHPHVRTEIERWTKFLDEWAAFVSGEPDFKMASVPKEIDAGPTFTDARQAATKAKDFRKVFNLGKYALPDLFVFLDEQSVLVCQAQLGTIGDGTKSISGVYLNHELLGSCILVNSQTSKGRQAFTLAHEYAHALFHYGMPTWIISREGADDSCENFANVFASNLLVPPAGLNEFITEAGWKNKLDPYKVVTLAFAFRVSYAFMLLRLERDHHINEEQKRNWKELSPSSLARQAGLDETFFQSQVHSELGIKRYPPSVLRKIKQFIEGGELSEAQVADLLGVDLMIIHQELLAGPSKAATAERDEFSEFESVV